MADEKQSGPGVGGNNLVILALAAVSAVYLGWQKPALETFRPTEAEHQLPSVRDVQDVDARLWQDPFAAVARYLADDPESRKSRSIQHDVSEFVNQLNRQESLVIGVTLPGGRYPVEVEERRRLRYAVVAALHTAKYVPEDAEHVGYVRMDEPGSGSHSRPGESLVASNGATAGDPPASDDLPSLQANVPFEWFSSLIEEKTDLPRIAVLWLDESVLRREDRPIGHLQVIGKTLQLTHGKFMVLGPHDSTTLAAMVREIGHYPHLGRQPLTIINFAATADAETVLRRAGLKELGEADKELQIENNFLASGVHYYRTIASDQVLANALVQELRRRRIEPGRKLQRPAEDDTKTIDIYPDHIALISELDSIYGQTLPQIIASL